MEPLVLKDRTAIAGIGQTAYAKSLPASELLLACQAIKAALDDAGIAPVRGRRAVVVHHRATKEVEVARNLGLGDITWFSQVGYGGGAGCGVVGNAAMAVATGPVPASRSRGGPASGARPRQPPVGAGRRTGRRAPAVDAPVRACCARSTRSPCSRAATCTSTAPRATTSPTSRSPFRKHANRNPAAMMHAKPMTRDDYMDARWISEPLCLFDNCLESDGAVAAVIVDAERARDLPQPPVLIHAFAQAIPQQHQTMTNYFSDDPLLGPAWACAEVLWRNADVDPADVDVAQLYDAFSPLVPLSLEGYGFCERGEGADVHRRRRHRMARRPPAGQHGGGGMSEAYVHGFNLVVEARPPDPGHVAPARSTDAEVVPGHERRRRADQRAAVAAR